MKKNIKNYDSGGLEKLNFTYITYKLAKFNLGNLCLQFKSAPFISMLSPTCKFYMSSKFHKLFASPISKKQSPSRHCPHNAGVSHILKTMSKVCEHLRCRQKSPESTQMSKRHHIPTHMHSACIKYTANAPGRIRPQSYR